jgi:hypothetical protein
MTVSRKTLESKLETKFTILLKKIADCILKVRELNNSISSISATYCLL